MAVVQTKAESGFSLVELLVVLVVVALVAAGVSFSIPSQNDERQLQHIARQLRDSLQWGADEAQINGRLMGLGISQNAGRWVYQWWEQEPKSIDVDVAPNVQSRWFVLPDSSVELPPDMVLEFYHNGRQQTLEDRPLLLFWPGVESNGGYLSMYWREQSSNAERLSVDSLARIVWAKRDG